MPEPPDTIADQIESDYQVLEPGRTDAWNPLSYDTELFYRLSMLHAVSNALRKSALSVPDIRVLDFGCGNGRSTRMYLQLGFMPHQLSGLDLRPGAVELARTMNPSVQFDVHDGEDLPFEPGTFDWIQLSTVMSSIRDHRHRESVAAQVSYLLKPNGFVFYFDLVRANDFAGSDIIHPEILFSSLRPLHQQGYHSWRFLQELNAASISSLYLNYCRIKSMLFPIKPSHEAFLFGK